MPSRLVGRPCARPSCLVAVAGVCRASDELSACAELGAFGVMSIMGGAIRPSTTLADLLTPLFGANPFAAVRASLRWRKSKDLEDGLAYGGQGRLRWWPVDSFFPALLF